MTWTADCCRRRRPAPRVKTNPVLVEQATGIVFGPGALTTETLPQDRRERSPRTLHAPVAAGVTSVDLLEKRKYSPHLSHLGKPSLGRRHCDVAGRADRALAERAVPHSRDSGAGLGGGGCLPA